MLHIFPLSLLAKVPFSQSITALFLLRLSSYYSFSASDRADSLSSRINDISPIQLPPAFRKRIIRMHDHAAERIAARNRKNDCKTLSLGRSGKFDRFLRLCRRCRRVVAEPANFRSNIHGIRLEPAPAVIHIEVHLYAVRHISVRNIGTAVRGEKVYYKFFARLYALRRRKGMPSGSLEAPPFLIHSSISAVLNRQSFPTLDAGIPRCSIQRITVCRFTPI